MIGKKRSHIYVTFVIAVFQKRAIWMLILLQFMMIKKNKIQQFLTIKTRINMFVIFAMLNFLIAMVFKDIFNLCMKRKGHIYVIFVVKVLLEKVK